MDLDVSINSVRAIRLSVGDGTTPEKCLLAAEQPVTVAIDGVGEYTLMCTPSEKMALAVGFAFTEGIISSVDDIDLLQACEDDPNRIRIRLSQRRAGKPSRARNLIVTSSCGLCGLEKLDELIDRLGVCKRSLCTSLSTVLAALQEMKALQTLFRKTGGAHAAAIFTAEGEIFSFAEDIGRHNALDKAIGKCLLARLAGGRQREAAGCGLAFSGRASFEIIVKAAMAGIELIAAVSAPSSLAVRAAERCGITLCGFVRGDHATVYCHESRLFA